MFRFRNPKRAKVSGAKGSEFRTEIWLVKQLEIDSRTPTFNSARVPLFLTEGR
jgi:hypothetical protein